MRHSGRPPGIRRGRVLAAAASALTVGVSVLASTGVIPVSTTGGEPALADEPRSAAALRASIVADRATDRADSPTDDDGPGDAIKQRNEQRTTEPQQTSGTNPEDALPADSGSGKRVVYRLSTNQVWLVDGSDDVRRSYLVSGTKFDQVKPGTYDVMRKRRHTTSYHGTERMEYMVTFTEGENAAIGFHDIPVDIDDGKPVQSLSQLGKSLSDGCVRQKKADAVALWEFAPIGTPVIVLN